MLHLIESKGEVMSTTIRSNTDPAEQHRQTISVRAKDLLHGVFIAAPIITGASPPPAVAHARFFGIKIESDVESYTRFGIRAADQISELAHRWAAHDQEKSEAYGLRAASN